MKRLAACGGRQAMEQAITGYRAGVNLDTPAPQLTMM
jgi:hypothetical protein